MLSFSLFFFLSPLIFYLYSQCAPPLLLVGFCFYFWFLFYGPGRWTEDVNNASGF
jgi:hypothetical protein